MPESQPFRVPIGCPNPRDFEVKAGEWQNDTYAREPARLQGISAPDGNHTSCLPCRRSRVRIPSAAFEKASICRPFLRAQSACASASGRTDSGLAPGRSSAVPRKRSVCRPILVRPNRSPSAGLQKDFGSDELESACIQCVFVETDDDRQAASPGSVRHDADVQADCAHEKDLQMQAFCEAAEGIRTLDLLHGKQ